MEREQLPEPGETLAQKGRRELAERVAAAIAASNATTAAAADKLNQAADRYDEAARDALRDVPQLDPNLHSIMFPNQQG